jgi:GABA(A) receptor-associated protein
MSIIAKQTVTNKEINLVINRYPGRIPVLVTKSKAVKSDIPDIPKNKFLVPKDITVGSFLYIIRKQLNLESDKALFIFVNETLPMSGMTMAELYSLHKSNDGLLRVEYTSESTFGFGCI